MRDWDLDGDVDVMDDVFYYEYMEDLDNEEKISHSYDDNDIDIDDSSAGYSSSGNTAPTSQPKYWNSNGRSSGLSRGGAFIIRLIIATIVIGVLESINMVLGLIALIIYIFIELSVN